MDDATRARFERIANMPVLPGQSLIAVRQGDICALLAAYDAQAPIVQAAAAWAAAFQARQVDDKCLDGELAREEWRCHEAVLAAVRVAGEQHDG